MPLVSTAEIVVPASRERRGVGAFNVMQSSTPRPRRRRRAAGGPVILQISENCVAYHGALEPIASATLAIARAATVPAGVHLDHAEPPAGRRGHRARASAR